MMYLIFCCLIILLCQQASAGGFKGGSADQYEQYVLTPRSRNVIPKTVYSVHGSVTNPQSVIKANGLSRFGANSSVTYDFGQNVAGIISFSVGNVSGENEFIGITFTESSLWISPEVCDATADGGLDEALWFSVSSGNSYSADKKHQRGGFKYLTVYHNSSGSVELDKLSVFFTAMPHKTEQELGKYTGYFHSNDDGVNRVWYAGAYTNEMCTIDPTAGDSLVHLGENASTFTVTTWYNNYTISNETSVLVDGAKRDRLVWPGDIAISGPSVFVSTNDMVTIQNSLDSLLVLQKSSGALPYAGIPFGTIIPVFSFTYHLYSLIDISDYYLYTGNLTYLQSTWEQFKLGLHYSLSFVDSSGLANVTSGADWLRFGMGGHNIEANSILYYTLNLGLSLAETLNDTEPIANWTSYAANIKTAANKLLWDPSANLYRDNDTLPLTSLHPQDGNCWAIISNITASQAQALNISTSLAARWGPYGAPAPEAGATVSPFISGFELQAHYLAGRPDRAIDLIKLMWVDFMLDDPRMTNSTFIEGYSTNGALHYAPYSNDPRISHAHGWATGPTSTLTFYTAGLKVLSAAGKTWSVAPSLGGLKEVEAGFQTPLGNFAVSVRLDSKNSTYLEISTPAGTSGTVSLPYPATDSTLKIESKKKNHNPIIQKIKAGGSGTFSYSIAGGDWEISLKSGK